MSRSSILSNRIFARPWKKDVSPPFLIGAIIIALLISFYGGTLLAPLAGTINGLLIGCTAANALLLGGAFLIPPRREGAFRLGMRRVTGKDMVLCAVALFVMLAGSMLLSFAWQQILDFFAVEYTKEQGLVQLAKEADFFTLLRLLLLTAFLVPLSEELVFRRCLYELLLKFGAPAAMVGTALIFSAAHGFLLGLPGLFFIGLVFQILCNTTRNLWCSIIAHAMLNATVLITAWQSAGAGE
jgi:membrane protease YdiL (CAAX protease family)